MRPEASHARIVIGALFGLLTLLGAGCSESAQEKSDIREHTITLSGLTAEESRTSLGAPQQGRIPFLWSEADSIGVTGAREENAGIPLVAGAGSQQGLFRGTILRSDAPSEPLRIYYPYSPSASHSIPSRQVQSAPGSSEHVGAADLAWDEATLTADGPVHFTLHHALSYLWIKLSSEAFAGWSVEWLRVSAEGQGAQLAGDLLFDWQTHTASLTGQSSPAVELTFTQAFVLSAEPQSAYLVIFPARLAGGRLNFDYRLRSPDGQRLLARNVRNGKDFTAGHTTPVTQAVAPEWTQGSDLNRAGSYANCYAVPPNTLCSFDARRKGNDSGLAGNSGYDTAPFDAAELASASLLWEATFDGDAQASSRIIAGEPVLYPDGHIALFTGSQQGNAAVAVKNAAGEILWSWHIWVTEQAERINSFAAVSPKGFMTCNLGALDDAPGEQGNKGLLYQWGRKDPFLPTSAPYSFTGAAPLNTRIGEGTLAWDFTTPAPEAQAAPGNIPASVRNPTTFYTTQDADWYIPARPATIPDQHNSQLWGGGYLDGTQVSGASGKTIFDPCPPGYKVPQAGAWGTASTGWTLPGSDATGIVWEQDGSAYYPFPGTLSSIFGFAFVQHFRYTAACWTATTFRSNYAVRLNMGVRSGEPFVYPLGENGIRGEGYSVRCIRE